MSNKEDIISKIYFDKSGFNFIKTTFNDVRKIDKTITLDMVKSWFRGNVEKKNTIERI